MSSNVIPVPDLSGASLKGLDFTGADLRWVDLSYADLRRASFYEALLIRTNLSNARLQRAVFGSVDLSEADLSGAALYESRFYDVNLSGANLHEADLSKANLDGANLHEADLSKANLSGANLHGADLSKANLDGTNISKAQISGTKFVDVDLQNIKGLETVVHKGPSSIGIDTIYLSQGKIPEVFLRGAGVPDNFIMYMHSLMGQAFEFYSCFISYSSRDEEFAQRLHNDLQAKGVRCWFAPKDMRIGDEIRPSIDQAIRHHDKVLLVLSENSISSRWVQKETETAFEEEAQHNKLVLFPIRLDNMIMETKQSWAADVRRIKHIGDFRRWKDHDTYQGAFERLLRDLKAQG